jgi:hypothetical protein
VAVDARARRSRSLSEERQYLLVAVAGHFARSEALSRLTEETLGIFQVNAKKKRLVTLAKSGCCFHVTQELAMVNAEPVVMESVTEDATGDPLVVTREHRVGRRWEKSVEHRALPKE